MCTYLYHIKLNYIIVSIFLNFSKNEKKCSN